MKLWDLRLSVCKLLSISHMNECLRRLIVPVVARGTATKNSMSSVIILCVDILLLLEPLQSLQRWALICDIITRDTNERVQQSTQQGSYKLSLSLWAPSLIPGSSSNNKPSGLFILALLWKEPLQIILQSLSWLRNHQFDLHHRMHHLHLPHSRQEMETLVVEYGTVSGEGQTTCHRSV